MGPAAGFDSHYGHFDPLIGKKASTEVGAGRSAGRRAEETGRREGALPNPTRAPRRSAFVRSLRSAGTAARSCGRAAPQARAFMHASGRPASYPDVNRALHFEIQVFPIIADFLEHHDSRTPQSKL